MNVSKISTMLCLGFQESEGPFSVLITFEGGQEAATLSKTEIQTLSDQELVIHIDLDRRDVDRRWRDRNKSERRG